MRSNRLVISWLLIAALVACFGSPGHAAGAERDRWTAATLETAARLPVQDQGRVKPLSTLASFALMRIHHKRSCKDAEGNRLEPIEWLLDTLFFPEETRTYPLFLVETYEVLEAANLPHTGKDKRDLYSYDELVPGRDRLMSLAHSYSAIEAKERTPVQAQVVNLSHNMLEYERLAHFLDFARARLDVRATPLDLRNDGDAEPRRFTEVLDEIPTLVHALQSGHGGASGHEGIGTLFDELSRLAQSGSGLRIVPPAVPKEVAPQWTSPGQLASEDALSGTLHERHLALLTDLEVLADAREEPAVFEQRLSAFAGTSGQLAAQRGELERVDLEVDFYSLDPFYRSLVLYILGFLLTAVSWLGARSKWVLRGAFALTATGLALHTVGIVLRCVLRGRPPVSTLYETILFVTAVVVLVALVIERIDRQRIAGSLAATLGALGLFIAMRFEEIQGQDTMPQLVAVLDTNFWLATHVTTISMGYAAGLLASAFAHIYVLGRVFGFRRDSDGLYRNLTRMTYGTLCFALIFSVIGTILGGVWANESWGRFWGWDPKENGALMIVLSQLAILHGRMGGFLRAFGLNMAAIAGGGIVAFSWWGVNLLGVGLHSYGFTDGIWRALIVFYTIEAAVLLAGFAWRLHSSHRLQARST